MVPDILEWELTQCDINKDFEVGEGPKAFNMLG
jgi:hypothetical protein